MDDRFNWQKTKADETVLKKSKNVRGKDFPNLLTAKEPKYKTMVNMDEKPQDQGCLNEACIKRDKLLKDKQNRIIKHVMTPKTINDGDLSHLDSI